MAASAPDNRCTRVDLKGYAFCHLIPVRLLGSARPHVARGPAVRGRGEEAAVEPDSCFEWVSPDERTRLPFSPGRRDALALAAEWDLCVAGDGLAHLQQAGLERSFIPLVQV